MNIAQIIGIIWSIAGVLFLISSPIRSRATLKAWIAFGPFVWLLALALLVVIGSIVGLESAWTWVRNHPRIVQFWPNKGHFVQI